MAKVITGTNAADTIKVWESGVTVNAGAGDDTIHLKKGTGSTVHAEAGNDTIYVHAGAHTVYGGAGDDIMVTWANAGNGSRFEGGAGDDSFKIKGGNNHTIVMGDGKLNTVNLDKGSGHKITGGNTGVDRLFICSDAVTNVEADLKNGENRATMWGGVTNRITGGADVDIFNVKGGTQNKLYGGDGKDYLIIHEGKQNQVYGGSGDDRLTVWHKSGDKNYLYGEDGNDIIEINGGNEHEIDGGDGYNTVKLKGGNKHTYTGGSGKDIVYISGGDGHTVNGRTGNDRIVVYSGSGHFITNDGGSDYIEIGKEAGDSIKVESGTTLGYKLNADETVVVHGGNTHDIRMYAGNDKVTVAGGNAHVIYTDVNSYNVGNDTIVIQDGGQAVKIVAGNGNDVIAVANGAGNGSTIYTGVDDNTVTGTGNNTVNLLGGSGHTVYLNGTTNRVLVEAQDVTLNTHKGSGNEITVHWSKEGTGVLRINCPDPSRYGNGGKTDFLKIEGVRSSDFKFEKATLYVDTPDDKSYASNSLVMTFSGTYHSAERIFVTDNGYISYNWCQGNAVVDPNINYNYDIVQGGTIEIARWNSYQAFNGITFDDGFKSFEQIKTLAGF